MSLEHVKEVLVEYSDNEWTTAKWYQIIWGWMFKKYRERLQTTPVVRKFTPEEWLLFEDDVNKIAKNITIIEK